MKNKRKKLERFQPFVDYCITFGVPPLRDKRLNEKTTKAFTSTLGRILLKEALDNIHNRSAPAIPPYKRKITS